MTWVIEDLSYRSNYIGGGGLVTCYSTIITSANVATFANLSALLSLLVCLVPLPVDVIISNSNRINNLQL